MGRYSGKKNMGGHDMVVRTVYQPDLAECWKLNLMMGNINDWNVVLEENKNRINENNIYHFKLEKIV